MAMRFHRDWDFDPGNKQLDLNSLTQDAEVQAALEALVIDVVDELGAESAAATGFTPAGSLEATNVQAALEELDGDVSTKVEATGTITKIEGPMTQVEYDAIVPDADTLYVIVG